MPNHQTKMFPDIIIVTINLKDKFRVRLNHIFTTALSHKVIKFIRQLAPSGYLNRIVVGNKCQKIADLSTLLHGFRFLESVCQPCLCLDFFFPL